MLEESKKVQIPAISIDGFKAQEKIEKIDFIKMDIEGAEIEALKGAEQTIINDRPQMVVCLYHSIDDYYRIPLYLKEVAKDYTFKIAKYDGTDNHLGAVLYAIPNEIMNA